MSNNSKNDELESQKVVDNPPKDEHAKSQDQTIEILKQYPSKGEGGSWLYGFILMAGGALFFVLGLMDLFNINFIYHYLVDQGYTDIAAMLPIMGVPNFVICFFAIIAGYGLIIDQEWGWGIAMFILVYTTAQSIVYLVQTVLSLSYNPSLITGNIVFWISLITTVVAIIGLIYLGLTKYKYA